MAALELTSTTALKKQLMFILRFSRADKIARVSASKFDMKSPKISQHWKVIISLNNQSTHQKADILTNIISSSGRYAALNKETASLLAKHYEKKSKLTFNGYDRKLLRIYRKTIQDSKRYNHKNIFTIPFLMEELEAAIAKMKPGKAPGPDVIFGRMVQHFGNLAKKKRTIEIFNLSWATGKLPKIWKLSIVIPILKPNMMVQSANTIGQFSSPAPSASSWNGLSTVDL
ncbi:putative RNA-directed DNA polymerase from transposon BS [Trichonephila clavipes]|nr:putative RNA-directed DNA polymerase from transposon BS [Trichonephila clavipes]